MVLLLKRVNDHKTSITLNNASDCSNGLPVYQTVGNGLAD